MQSVARRDPRRISPYRDGRNTINLNKVEPATTLSLAINMLGQELQTAFLGQHGGGF